MGVSCGVVYIINILISSDPLYSIVHIEYGSWLHELDKYNFHPNVFVCQPLFILQRK